MRYGSLRAIAPAFTLFLSVFPSVAFAHPSGVYAYGFAGGFAHPIAGADHILAMVTVGIFAWQLGGRAVWLIPSAFVLLMGAGGALAKAGIAVPSVEVAIAGTVIVLGALVALSLRVPVAVATVAVALFAIFHGLAHGSEMPTDVSLASYAAGFMLATALLHGIGIGLGGAVSRFGERRGRLAYALCGGSIAIVGVGILAGAL